MTEKPKFVQPLSQVKAEINQVRLLVDSGADAQVIDNRVQNLYSWLTGLADEIAQASSGSSRYDGNELFSAQYVLEAFLQGYEVAINLKNGS